MGLITLVDQGHVLGPLPPHRTGVLPAEVRIRDPQTLDQGGDLILGHPGETRGARATIATAGAGKAQARRKPRNFAAHKAPAPAAARVT